MLQRAATARLGKSPSPFGLVPFALRTLCVVAVVCTGCTNAPYPFGYPAQGQYPPAVNLQPGALGTASLQAPTTGPASVYAQQQTHPQIVELQRRVQQLDDNNRQLTTQIAQSQQQAQAFRERSELLAKQLQDATAQNKQLLAATQQYANQARGMQTSMSELQDSMRMRGGARLTANNSLDNTITSVQIPGARVLADGDVIRIRIASDQLFVPGSTQLMAASTATVDQVANALLRQYPRQRVAIEGHTDNSQIDSGNYSNAYQISSAQAQAVLDQLVRRNGVPMQQLFVVAHGPNRPIADNQSPAGRAENRRIEVVVYPDTF